MTPINIVWFKRDLRLSDHQPLKNALQSQQPTLLIYLFEPSLISDPHYSTRHWRFISQSLAHMNQQLACYGTQVFSFQSEVLNFFKHLLTVLQKQSFTIDCIYSHEEIGLDTTFQRDLSVARWCQENHINWQESSNGAVIRGASNRENWDKHWKKVMKSPLAQPDFTQARWFDGSLPTTFRLEEAWLDNNPQFQKGGELSAHHVLEDFFEERGQYYSGSLSSPSKSRIGCSRLSPYLAWGNLSVRQVYQKLLQHWTQPGWRRSLSALSSRLHWHCHFIQKFESESDIEFRPMNAAYNDYPYVKGQQEQNNFEAWAAGRTGFPLIDACVRCLQHTGYINFRMRAMLVSFACHHLNLDWRLIAKPLAQWFLDFEPGIHYPQIQMQAGITGINTIRIYNPIKQAQDHDSEGDFVRQWVPEMAAFPKNYWYEPWKMPPLERQMVFDETQNMYPEPIINLKIAAKEARDRLWGWRKNPEVAVESQRILARHVRQ
ncbi:MAG: deoxyribodipyrimidine photo-lyase [Pseudomonadota bacterium]